VQLGYGKRRRGGKAGGAKKKVKKNRGIVSIKAELNEPIILTTEFVDDEAGIKELDDLPSGKFLY
jgi:hypothetical protein